MGVFEKLKNIFFEEEYVEVEEPVRKKAAKEQSVAKKIELPEIKRKKEESVIEKASEEKNSSKEPVDVLDKEIVKHNNNFKFPMNFEEDDFKNDEYIPEKKEAKTIKKETITEEKKEQRNYSNSLSGLYEGNIDTKKKKEFKPTPIISPIYGILDKNYKKDEIVTKKEIRISSSPKNVDLDTVREKAYGDLASDITASMYEDEEESDVEGDDNSLLYDLNDDTSPAVTKVTVGDAEEYYNDLGLEYNIDYKDNTKEKATGRRIKQEKEDVNKKANKEQVSEENKEESAIEDNLFDLIDSMYEDKE